MKVAQVSLRLLAILTVLTGIVYPVAMTLIGQAAFPERSGGSLIEVNGRVVGSQLIGQKFVQDQHFWGRPSAIDYNPLPSGGTNFAPTSVKLAAAAVEQTKRFLNVASPPQELLYASASGLDPHITVEAARIQIDRVLQARGWDQSKKQALENLIRDHTSPRQIGFLGQARVNVLELNLALNNLR